MRPLIINEETSEKLGSLRRYAEVNHVSIRHMLEMTQGKRPPIGNNPNHARLIPVGFRVVFSIEEHMKNKYRHLSVSLTDSDKAPNPGHVAEIARLLGFSIEENLEFTKEQILMPGPIHGWRVPNLLERL